VENEGQCKVLILSGMAEMQIGLTGTGSFRTGIIIQDGVEGCSGIWIR
jgi:hypothetical protein